MPNKKSLDKTHLLQENEHNDYASNKFVSTSSTIIDFRNGENILSSIRSMQSDSDSDWINSISRYGGETMQRRDINGNYEYKTIIFDNLRNLETKINEKLMNIYNKAYSAKEIRLQYNIIILELSNLDDNKQLQQKYKIYQNEQAYYDDLKSFNLETFKDIHLELSWYKTIAIWTNNFLHDSKKVLQGVGYLGIVIGIKTIQRAFTVIVSSKDEIDWDKLIKTINPIENPIDFGLTLPQLLISVLAIDAWKWGLTNIGKEISKIIGRETIQTVNSESVDNPNYFKSIFKILGTKLGYWIPNHLMTTCSSMYSVKSLTSVSAYLYKLKSGWNILSTMIRAEALWFISGFLKDGLSKFGETYIYNSIKINIKLLFEKLKTPQTDDSSEECSKICQIMMSLFKVVVFVTTMIGATLGDNANKTAIVMWTADKLDEFVSTFFTEEMALIMLGLISVDTIGNKYCNVKAKQELSKIWNNLKSTCGGSSTNEAIVTSDDEFYDALDSTERQLLLQKVTKKAQKQSKDDVLKKYKEEAEKYYETLEFQQPQQAAYWDENVIKKQTEFNTNDVIDIEQSQSPTSTGIAY